MVSAAIQIRRATLSDAPFISRILLSAFESFRPLYTEGGFTATTSISELIVQRFDEGPVWVAFIEDEAVGTVSGVVRGERLSIRSMAVNPASRVHGVGSALLRSVEGYAAS